MCSMVVSFSGLKTVAYTRVTKTFSHYPTFQSACSTSQLNEKCIYMCSLAMLVSKRACVASWLKERRVYLSSMLVFFCGLNNVHIHK